MLTHLALGMYSRRFKKQPVQLPFEILMYLCALWTVTFVLDISSESLAFKIFLMKIRFLGVPFISLSLMLIAILFSGHEKWLTKRRMALLLAIPVITVFLALTTEYSTVFRYNYSLIQTDAGFFVLGFANGIWTRTVYLPFNYLEEAVTLLLLLQMIFGSMRLYARQALFFFIAVLIPAIADILFLFGITPVKNYNIVPSTFAFTAVLLAIALFQYRFLDIVPIARNTLFERMSDPMLVIDREGRFADFNPAAEKTLGLCRATNLWKGAIESLHDHEQLCACIKETHPACRTITIGTGAAAREFEISMEKLVSGEGVLHEKLILLRDVTDYRRMERDEVRHTNQIQMLLELHQHANKSAEFIMDFVLEATLNTTQSCYSWLGLLDEAESVMTIRRWSREAMADCAIIEKPIQYPLVEAGLWGECIKQRTPLLINSYDDSHPGKNGFPGGHVPIHRLLVVPIFDEGRIVAAAAVANKQEIYMKYDQDALTSLFNKMWEILKRKKAEEALLVSEEKFRKAFFISPDSVSINRLSDGMFVSINRGFTEISGYTDEEIIGKTSLEIDIWKNQADRKNIVQELLAKGEVRDYEASFLTKKGEIDGLMFASIIELNGVPHILNITRDMTARKKAERSLRESEERYHTLYNNMQEGVALHELVYDDMGQAVEYKIIDVNPKFVSILNLARDFVINKPSAQAYGTTLPPYLSQYSAVALSGIPSNFETYFPPLDKHLEISVSPWGCNGFATIFTDITERKRAQEELARYARRLIIINRMDRIVTSSLDIEQVYDRFVEDLRGLVPIDRTSIVLLDESGEHWTVAMIWTGYEPLIRKGEWGDVKGSAIEWIVNQKLPLVESEIGEKGDWTENEPLRQEKIRSRVLLPLIIRDEVAGMLSLASRQPAAFGETDLDILMPLSDQFSLALQNSRLYDQLKQQSQQLEKTVEERTAQLKKANKELEAFSYSVSHDLRSPLRAVDGFSRILLEEHLAELSPDARHYLNLVRSNAVQMGQLIDDLLTFSRTSRQPLAKRSVDPAEVVRQVLEELHGELEGRKVDVIVGALPSCQADPAMLRRVFFNLISNAVKFTHKKEEARIEVGSINNEGKTVYFVKDNGVGFDMRYSGKLFGVFSRLHSESDYEGTGVGLALVQRIVHRHGGSVWAEACVDKGATFYFTLVGSESL